MITQWGATCPICFHATVGNILPEGCPYCSYMFARTSLAESASISISVTHPMGTTYFLRTNPNYSPE